MAVSSMVDGRWSMVVHLWNQLENEIYVDAFETTLFDALYLSSNITVFISSKVHFSLKCFFGFGGKSGKLCNSVEMILGLI